jgi:hypothetical protein
MVQARSFDVTEKHCNWHLGYFPTNTKATIKILCDASGTFTFRNDFSPLSLQLLQRLVNLSQSPAIPTFPSVLPHLTFHSVHNQSTMPLNYSKWDNLEVSHDDHCSNLITVTPTGSGAFVSNTQLSDDSDIEGHPNVDKKSLIRWKQRDIHEKREMRNAVIAQLQADIACNEVLLPRLQKLADELSSANDAAAEFANKAEQLKDRPSPESPPGPNARPYDEMILALLLRVYQDVKDKGVIREDPGFGNELILALKVHITQLGEDIDKKKADLDKELKEKAKKITTEGIHEGFESKVRIPYMIL